MNEKETRGTNVGHTKIYPPPPLNQCWNTGLCHHSLEYYAIWSLQWYQKACFAFQQLTSNGPQNLPWQPSPLFQVDRRRACECARVVEQSVSGIRRKDKIDAIWWVRLREAARSLLTHPWDLHLPHHDSDTSLRCSGSKVLSFASLFLSASETKRGRVLQYYGRRFDFVWSVVK